MGKRELMLIVGFVLVGALVYQFTAPAGEPGKTGRAWSRLVEGLRREVSGQRAKAEAKSATVHPVSKETRELRLTFTHGGGAESLIIAGEDRTDVASELRVTSNGYDDAEAGRLANATALTAREGAGLLSLNLAYPEEGNQRATLVLKVPSRLLVQVPRFSGRLEISHVAGIELHEARGNSILRQINGRVVTSHNGGEVAITEVDALKLNVRGADARLSKIRGDVTVEGFRGEVRASELRGTVEIDINGTDTVLEQLGDLTGPVRVRASGGSLTMRGLRTDTRVDGRGTEIDVSLARAAPLTIYSDGDEETEVTLPPDGCQLDLVAANRGRITLPPETITVQVEEAEQRASGAVHGGGPNILVRASRGNIVVRPYEASTAEQPAAESVDVPKPPSKPQR